MGREQPTYEPLNIKLWQVTVKFTFCSSTPVIHHLRHSQKGFAHARAEDAISASY